MNESIVHIAKQIKQARQAKGLSQRALSRKVGIPQSHISKIENGAVNLQLSSLVELARVLDLELMLIPKKAQTATKTIVKQTRQTDALIQANNALNEFEKALQSAYSAYSVHSAKDAYERGQNLNILRENERNLLYKYRLDDED